VERTWLMNEDSKLKGVNVATGGGLLLEWNE
jgi:hypothetical protein